MVYGAADGVLLSVFPILAVKALHLAKSGGDAGAQYDAVTGRLFALPDATVVWPGHDYKGRTSSTIGDEKKNNPWLFWGPILGAIGIALVPVGIIALPLLLIALLKLRRRKSRRARCAFA